MELSSDTANLLRPHQVVEAKEELQQLTDTLNAPPHIRSRISDMGQMRQRRDNLKKELEKSTPKAFVESERDAAVREFKTLEDKIRQGMPSSEEMRRNPPGAVGKQLAWDQAQRGNVMRYKNLALRLAAGGDLPPDMKYEGDIANIERLRPLTTTRQLAMDGAQIPKATDFHFGADIVGTVLFTDEEMAALKLYAPALCGALAVMDNVARAEIKDMLARLMGAPDAPAPEDAAAEVTKPEIKDLSFNQMKSMCAKAGLKIIGMKKSDMIAALRSRHLIQ